MGLTLPRHRIPLLVSIAALLNACAAPPSGKPPGTETRAGEPSVTPLAITPELVAYQQSQRLRRKAEDLGVLIDTAVPYTIGPGDVLAITVWGHPELTVAQLNGNAANISPVEQAAAAATAQGFVVGPQGTLQFPFAGTVAVGGLTDLDAAELLRLRLARYIQQPSVTLRVQSYRSQRIYVDGDVRSPGLQAINDIPMHLLEALNRAGGILPTGDQSRIAILRGSARYQISLPELVRQGIDPSGILLRHGDAVRVPSADEGKVFITGEVMTPKALPMHNGRLTLNEAIGEAGGINTTTGDPRQVYVVRRNGNDAVVYQLDAGAPGAMAVAESFELSPRDTVYVAQSALANWHRTLSLLIPGSLPSAVSASRQ